ncbi:hypothetical protein LshimejAT787_0408150 [Lyophyllum shimeji]|uniref:Uncharacterized protein n=1 Tax=Lyophyllum shimeji TaxID=47721 RepID=A0A9P3UK75_LYOSH|nr:hypothetical protein LshimejAT787_0408150 [Lyophyllum shimeji]
MSIDHMTTVRPLGQVAITKCDAKTFGSSRWSHQTYSEPGNTSTPHGQLCTNRSRHARQIARVPSVRIILGFDVGGRQSSLEFGPGFMQGFRYDFCFS